jgi:beta-lactamase superfamily II metal-dependent hydrolase
MDLQVFDVEHGQCAMLTSDVGTRLMIDCGHNASTGWTPGGHLQRLGVTSLDHLCITNYDEDHVSGFRDLESRVFIRWMSRNMSVSGTDLYALKSDTGIGPNMAQLASKLSNFSFSSAPLPSYADVIWEIYCNAYPTFDDENNLSMVVVLKIKGTIFIFPGDLECAGWLKLLNNQPGLCRAVTSADVLIASHHGRENGICPEMFDALKCKPAVVIISDDYHQYDTQKTTGYYASKCRGAMFRGSIRKVLTTRSDGEIRFGNFTNTGCSVF